MPAENTPVILLMGPDGSLRLVLEALGYMVLEVARVALIPATATAVDRISLIVLTDEHVSALECLVTQLRQIGCSAPLLLLSRRPNREMRSQAFSHGVLDVVSLPCAIEELRVRLRMALTDGPAS